MTPEQRAEELGKLIGAGVLVLLPLYALVRMLFAKSLSSRLTYVSLACGLLIWTQPQLVFGLTPATHGTYFIISGIVRGILGVTGIVAGAVSISLRRKEGAGRGAGNVLGILLSVVLVFLGAGDFLLKSRFSTSTAGEWTYKNEKYGFSIVLPSSEWKQVSLKDGEVGFRNRTIPVQVGVYARVIPKAQYASEVDTIRRFVCSDEGSLAPPTMEDGLTKHGDKYTYIETICKMQSGKGACLSALLFHWHEGTQVMTMVVFEGELKMVSETWSKAEAEFYRSTARSILLSLKWE
jgi:hypothetical protein